jgi:hypothetical protein
MASEGDVPFAMSLADFQRLFPACGALFDMVTDTDLVIYERHYQREGGTRSRRSGPRG